MKFILIENCILFGKISNTTKRYSDGANDKYPTVITVRFWLGKDKINHELAAHYPFLVTEILLDHGADPHKENVQTQSTEPSDEKDIYEIPLVLRDQGLGNRVCEKLKIAAAPAPLNRMRKRKLRY